MSKNSEDGSQGAEPRQTQAQPMQQQPATGPMEGNQGEGNREAGKAYNDGATRTARSGVVPEKAAEARDALDGTEGEALREAEREGRSHAKDEDPAVRP